MRLFDPARPHFAACQGCATLLCLTVWFPWSCGTPDRYPFTERQYQGWFSQDPLHAALVKGHLDIASLLLKNGADPNFRDYVDWAPLYQLSQVDI
jgi:hypothetical protein